MKNSFGLIIFIVTLLFMAFLARHSLTSSPKSLPPVTSTTGSVQPNLAPVVGSTQENAALPQQVKQAVEGSLQQPRPLDAEQ